LNDTFAWHKNNEKQHGIHIWTGNTKYIVYNPATP
jgi:hypothetical protein